MGDGRLPESMVAPLLGTGRWLRTNGEAIYGTKGFPFGHHISECSSDTDLNRMDKCYTMRGDTVYVIYLRYPPRKTTDRAGHRLIHLEHLVPTSLTAVSLLGSNISLSYAYIPSGHDQGFNAHVPELAPDELQCELDRCHAFVFRITHVNLTFPVVFV